MGLAVSREEIVWPNIFARGGRFDPGAHGGRSGRRGAIPILGRIGDSPDIPGIVKGDANQKMLPVLAERQTIRYAARAATSSGQIAQQYWGFKG